MKGMFGDDPYIRAMEAKAKSVNEKRGSGLGILPATGVMIGHQTEGSIPIKPNNFYGD